MPLLALLLAGPATAAPALPGPGPTGQWWVVVGSSPDPEYIALSHPAADRAAIAAKRCGIVAEGDVSGKWQGFAPGYYVMVAGGYRSRAEAQRALAQVRPCVPDAYVRQGAYAGD